MAKALPNQKTKAQTIDESLFESRLPLEHVAIIMDGNRRWAEDRNQVKMMGHKEGVKTLKQLVRHVGRRGLKYLTVYAFSSENWQRSKEEVGYLLDLFQNVLMTELEELAENDVKLSFIGDTAQLPERLQRSINRAETKTANNKGLALQVAINYGSRMEITQAAKRIAIAVAAGEISSAEITDELISKYLYTCGIPDPELLIRTGGEQRLSNYLLWQAAYTEIYVTPILWPDFTPLEFEQAIADFAGRQRRYGT